MDEGRRSVGSWIEGARAAGVDLGYPGERLGLPREGSGSIAGSGSRYGRRVLALIVDWVLAMGLAAAVAAALHWNAQSRSLATLLIFGLLTWPAVALLGTTVGKRLCGLRVVRVDGRPAGLLWGLVRTALLLAVVPALFMDRDYRGLHDRAAGTVVVLR